MFILVEMLNKTTAGKNKIGITLSDITLKNLNSLIELHKKETGVELTKSQMLTRLINSEWIKNGN